jgi:hypothetical protein
MTFSPASYASKLLSMTASAMSINSRRLSASFDLRRANDKGTNVQMEIILTGMIDAKSLKVFVDGKLAVLLARSGIRVQTLSSEIVTPLNPVVPISSSNLFTMALATGLGVGIPLLLLVSMGIYMCRKPAKGKKAAAEKESNSGLTSSELKQTKPSPAGDSPPEYNASVALTFRTPIWSNSVFSTSRPLIQNWNTVQEDEFFLAQPDSEIQPSVSEFDDFVQYTGVSTVQTTSRLPITEESIQYSQAWNAADHMADVPGIVETVPEQILELSSEETRDLGQGAWA